MQLRIWGSRLQAIHYERKHVLYIVHVGGWHPSNSYSVIPENPKIWSVQACGITWFVKDAADAVGILQGKGLENSVGNFSL